jgi:hypothetical protein
MEKRLSTFGELFEGTVKIIAKVGVGLFRRRMIEKSGYVVFGSINKRDVIAAVFHSYNLACYGEGWSFIFFVGQPKASRLEKRNRSSIHRRRINRRASFEQPLHNEDSV